MIDLDSFKNYKATIEIDYFTYFTKCYFAFNAYLQAKYKEGKDREKIDSIKNETLLQKRFMELCENSIFIDNLVFLRDCLYEAQISNESVVISFERVKIQSFQNKTIKTKKNLIEFELNIKAGKDEKISFCCKNSKGNEICNEECKYNELEQKLNETQLSKTQRDTIKALFDQEIKQYNQNLTKIINKLQDLEQGQNLDTKEIELLYKGFIEIIYLLRNILFHSKINPKQNSIHNTYKTAYILFKDFIYKLPEESQ